MATIPTTGVVVTTRETKTLARKERERLARRRDIVQAARAVFAEKGFSKATLDEIAERAEYGKGTVYNYFESKESLFAAAMMNLFDDVCDIAQRVSEKSLPVRDSLVEYAHRMMEYYRANYYFCRMLMREWVRPEIEHADRRMEAVHARVQSVAQPLAALLKAAMRRREVRRGDPIVLASMFIGLVHHYYMHVASQAPPKTTKDLHRHAELIVSVFFDGIAEQRAAP